MNKLTAKLMLKYTLLFLLFTSKYTYAIEYTFTRQIGAPSSLKNVSSVAEGANNEVYIADAKTSEIRVYSSSGAYLRKWTTLSAQYICSSPSGNIYAVSPNGNSIYKYSNTGVLLATLATGQVIFPNGIASDQNENIYVLHNRNGVKKFNSNGQYQMIFWGSDNVLWDVRSLFVTSSGIVHVLHDGNWLGYSISSFNPDGSVLNHGGSPFSVNAFMSTSFTVDGFGNFYISYDDHKIGKFSANKQPANTWGKFGSADGEYNKPVLTIEHSGLILIADLNDRLQKINGSGVHQITYGSNVVPNGEIANTVAAAYDKNGNVFAADRINNTISKFDANGNFVLRFGSRGNLDGNFINICDLVVDNNGDVYVAEYINGNEGNGRIQKFSNNGTFIKKFNVGGTIGKSLELTQEQSQRLVVYDAGTSKVYLCNLDGSVQSSWGTGGTNVGQISSIADICLSSTNDLYLLQNGYSGGNIRRVQKFDLQGTYLSSFGSYGKTDALLNSVSGIAEDDNGDLLIADNNKIKRFNSGGVYQSSFAPLTNLYYNKITKKDDKLLLPSSGPLNEYSKNTTTGFSDFKSVTLNAYPNPSEGILYFDISIDEKILNVKSFDVTGKSEYYLMNDNKIDVSLKGLITVVVTTDKAVYISKVLIK